MPVSSSPVPLGEKGHYAFVFPLRPGETRFQVSYRLPYSGSLKFSERLALPAENVAIIMPKSMKFTPSASTAFQPINDDPNGADSFGQECSCVGAGGVHRLGHGLYAARGAGRRDPRKAGLRRATSDQPTSPEAGSAAAASDTRPGGGLGNPIDTPDPLTKYRWWILGSLSLILAAAAAFFLRSQAPAAAVTAGAPIASPLAPTVGKFAGSAA